MMEVKGQGRCYLATPVVRSITEAVLNLGPKTEVDSRSALKKLITPFAFP